MIIPRGFSHPVCIGTGAYSSVYRVYQKTLERQVALKSILLKSRDRTGIVEREAKILSAIRLPCVPHIYEIKQSRLQIHIIMEWIYGIPLSNLMDAPITLEMKMGIANDLVHAIAQLHSAGIVHRDVKPDNIMVTPDRGIVFVDFGFSYQANHLYSETVKTLQGTPAYMAPELWVDSGEIDYRRADLYSTGIVLKELLGSAFPEFAETLIHVSPLQRPQSITEFENEWIRNTLPYKTGIVSGKLEELTAIYAASLLYNGARELYGKKRREEAYGLLTESLEIWSDNPVALDFLQQQFSMPQPLVNKKRLFFRVAGVIIVLIAIAGAYISGRNESISQLVRFQTITREPDDRLNSLLSVHRNMKKIQTPVVLRDSIGTNDVTGTCIVILPENTGNLLIDGKDQLYRADSIRFSGIIAAGSHRIEWYDSLQKRRYSETIDLLPFSTRVVSFKRFIHGL